jgi:hypothetical protein
MNPQDTVQAVELAPLTATATRAARVEVVPQQEQQKIFGSGFDPAKLVELKLGDSAPLGGGISQKVWCGANGRSMLYVRYDQPGEHTLAPYIKEQVVLVPDARSVLPRGSIAPPSGKDGARILTGLNCGPLSPSPNVEVGFALQTQLSLDEPQLEHEWWSHAAWSSEDSWRMPERVYRLEDIVLPILKGRMARPTEWGRVVLHIKRD